MKKEIRTFHIWSMVISCAEENGRPLLLRPLVLKGKKIATYPLLNKKAQGCLKKKYLKKV